MIQNGAQLRETLQQLNCREVEDFEQIFGRANGSYIWDKFCDMDQNIFDLICYLDPGNIELLFEDLTKDFAEPFLRPRRVNNCGPTHDNICDVNPENLTWRRTIPKGESAQICGECWASRWSSSPRTLVL